MPIDRTEFDSVQVGPELEKLILDFLGEHPEQAFEVEEIAAGLEHKLRTMKHGANAQVGVIDLRVLQVTLESLVDMGRAVGGPIQTAAGARRYYSAAKKEPVGPN
jgi:hypothetical protein